MTDANRAILILGMHRSGTSALAGVLSELGVNFSDKLMPPIPGVNDKGFYEHVDLVAANESILSALDRSWLDLDGMPEQWWQNPEVQAIGEDIRSILQRDFASPGILWGLKDPRMCRLMPLWNNLLAETETDVSVVFCVRNPLEVAGSLNRRDGLDLELGLVLWFLHVLECERNTRDFSRTWSVYGNLLEDWKSETDQIGRELDIDWPVSIAQAIPHVEAFLEESLRHVREDDSPISGELAGLAVRFFEDIKSGQCVGTSAFDAYRTEFEAQVAGLSGYIPMLNAAQQGLYEYSALTRELDIERQNASEQISYRDKLIEKLRQQVLDEKQDAKEQITYRDALIADYEEVLSSERKNTTEQIEYREALLAEIRQQLADEKQNAHDQITYRDQQIVDRDQLLASRKHLLKTLVKLSLPGKS